MSLKIIIQGFPTSRINPSGSVSPSVDINKILEFSSIPNFLRISVSYLLMWLIAPRLTAPDSPDMTRWSSPEINNSEIDKQLHFLITQLFQDKYFSLFLPIFFLKPNVLSFRWSKLLILINSVFWSNCLKKSQDNNIIFYEKFKK